MSTLRCPRRRRNSEEEPKGDARAEAFERYRLAKAMMLEVPKKF